MRRGNFLVKLSAFFLFCSIVMMRPMILGNDYSLIGLGSLVFLTLFTVFHHPSKIQSSYIKIYLSILFCWSYFLLQAVALQSSGMLQAANTYVTVLLSSLCFAILFSDAAVEKYFVRCFIGVLCVCAVSWCLSFAGSLFVGWDRLFLAEIDYGYFAKALFYFPATVAYNRGNMAGIEIVRLLSVFRESGIAQIFYAWAFFVADQYFTGTPVRWVRGILGLGVMACFSTAGFITFAIALLCSIKIRKNAIRGIFLTISAVAFITYMIFFAEGTSIAYKETHMNGSISVRWNASMAGMDLLKDHLFFGIGAFTDTHVEHQGISLIAFGGQIGLVGLFLVAMIWAYGWYGAKSKRKYVIALMPFIITALFSQPLVTAPVCYILFFFSYAEVEERASNETRHSRIIREIKENRRSPLNEYRLNEIVIIAVCGIIAGGEDFEEIVLFAHSHKKWFQKFLRLRDGIPSERVLERYFQMIDSKAFNAVFEGAMRDIYANHREDIPYSGRYSSGELEEGGNDEREVSAWLWRKGMRIKSDMVFSVLDSLALEGILLRFEGGADEKKIMTLLRKKHADYIIAVGETDERRRQDICRFADFALKTQFWGIEYHMMKEYTKHKRKIWEYYLLPGIDGLPWKKDYPDSQAVGVFIYTVQVSTSKTLIKRQYYMTSIRDDVRRFASGVRGYWGMEDEHCSILDLIFMENIDRRRKTHIQKNFATARSIALNLIRQECTQGRSIRKKRFLCGINIRYLEKVFFDIRRPEANDKGKNFDGLA